MTCKLFLIEIACFLNQIQYTQCEKQLLSVFPQRVTFMYMYLPACLSWRNVTICRDGKAAESLSDVTFTGVAGAPDLKQCLHGTMICGQGENLLHLGCYLFNGHIRGILASIDHVLNTSGHLLNATVKRLKINII